MSNDNNRESIGKRLPSGTDRSRSARVSARLRGLAFVVLASLLAGLFLAAGAGLLGAVPEERLLHQLGLLGLGLLLATLSLGPLSRLTGSVVFLMLRRQLGLWAFVYLTAHLLVWMGGIQFWEFAFIALELRSLPYLWFGAGAWMLLVPLVLTSIRLTQRWMGLRRWRWLHKLVYPATALGLVHVWLLSRVVEPGFWVLTGCFLLLLGSRLVAGWRDHRRTD